MIPFAVLVQQAFIALWISVVPHARLQDPSQSAAVADTLAARLDSLVARAFAPYPSGGVVLVARRGQPVLRRAYGLADVERAVPMRLDHAFRIGSISKQFTAFAILQLVERGRLRLDDDVRTHVPDFATHGRRVTIEQLLTHTAGVPTLVDLATFDSLAQHAHSVSQLLALTRNEPLHFEPGTAMRYSDTGYILLGAVIERVSGLSYAEYVATQLATPLGLHHTAYAADTTSIDVAPIGYTMQDGRVERAPFISMSIPHAAGALASTVDDLLRWQIAMRAGRIVAPRLVAQAWATRTFADGSVSGYGFGVKMCPVGGARTVAHGGFINGFSSTAIQLPEHEIDVIVLVNNDADAPDAGQLARRITRVMLGQPPVPAYIELSDVQRRLLVGRYALAADDIREIVDSAGMLFSRRNRGTSFRLQALAPLELTLEESEGAYVMRFDMDRSGAITQLRTLLSCEPRDVARRLP